ncbi:ornithine--oxo-acid transaminase [Pseudenhygromyxa sp. WMMC2535]|uniref:ornithine--oxo-acid transaminase n=1 Tax=Pseudenhygromyxa sp. WMMC2535 TaxID=2712867 RepID=UPI001555E6E0|nr:ornithine--oxo-acid transaminase [Pseudenhygromyxa sp. WMMC2535]NVB41320.1 ornithine--oxo-acid transaminase [Pseudenhygromyxa sp. WMMC2535]
MSDVDPGRWIALEDRYAAHNYHPLDVVLTRGEGPWVWDLEGKRYLDCLAAYSAVNQGHNHPRIVTALIEQAKQLALTSRAFRNDRFGPLCKQLSELSGYERVLMMNSGAEAVETAIKAARKWGYEVKGVPAGAAKIVVCEGNFHGRTTTIVGFSTDEGARGGFGPFTPGFEVVRYGDLDAAQRVFSEQGEAIVAVLVEPVQGEGGVIIPPADYLPGLRTLCDEHRALLICDEIQSGLGRCGALFAHSLSGVRADGVTIGKALSGGLYPVSAFLADAAVMDVFTPGTHGSTYGGNPLACAVAEAALGVLVDEQLISRSAELGAWMRDELEALRSPHIKALRAIGLWYGIELHPEAGGARRFCEALQREGILCKETHTHTIRLAPPLVVEKADLEWALARLRAVLGG